MSASHVQPRADSAARSVDPLVLASALDHIACTAAKSRSQTRRIRWIQARAEIALRGEDYRDIDLDLPKSAGPNTQEKLQKRLAYELAIKRELLEALRVAVRQNEHDMLMTGEELRQCCAAIAKATGEQA